MRWFGQTWNAPVNHPDYQIPIPIGELCEYCAIPFDSESQGTAVPLPDGDYDSYHRLCWLKLTVGPDVAEFVERTLSGRQAGQEQQAAGHGRAEQSA